MNMTSNCDVTNSAPNTNDYHMPLNETPPMKIFCVRHCLPVTLLQIYMANNRTIFVASFGVFSRVAESQRVGGFWVESDSYNNTRSRSWIILTDFDSGSPIEPFLHRSPKVGTPVEMVQFLLKLSLKQIIIAVYHDFHWLLVATKLLAVRLHSRYVTESVSDILERLELESQSNV